MEIILILVAFAFLLIGFYLGRKKNKTTIAIESCSHSYAKGLNYLLANESDKAIQLFVDLIKVDGETAETHLALGKLFRSKGEVDKAIKIHLNILAKPSLDVAQRVQVLFELGNDYLKAGLLDRSENVFKELLELDKNNIPALLNLQNLYIAEKSWLDAIVYSERLKKLNYKDSQQILTHCYCELAELKAAKKDFHLAKKYLQIALEFDVRCIRAFILRLKIEIDEGQFKQAEKTLNVLIQSHVKAIDLFIDQIYSLFKKQDKMNQYTEYLGKHNLKFTNKVINLALLNYYFDNSDLESGYQLLDNILSVCDDLDIYEMALKQLTVEQFGAQKYAKLLQFLQQYNNQVTHYNCTHCGYSSKGMQWQCPSCNSWSSMSMIHNKIVKT